MFHSTLIVFFPWHSQKSSSSSSSGQIWNKQIWCSFTFSYVKHRYSKWWPEKHDFYSVDFPVTSYTHTYSLYMIIPCHQQSALVNKLLVFNSCVSVRYVLIATHLQCNVFSVYMCLGERDGCVQQVMCDPLWGVLQYISNVGSRPLFWLVPTSSTGS